MRGFPLTLQTNTVGHFVESNFDSTKSHAVHDVKGKTRNLNAYLCGSLYSTLSFFVYLKMFAERTN